MSEGAKTDLQELPGPGLAPPVRFPAASIPALEEDPRAELRRAIDRAVDHLLRLQAEQGYWVGELEADTTLESDYILYLHIIAGDAAQVDRARVAKLANYIRRRQLSNGGWSIYPGGPAELNATVKAYLGLKLAGDSPDAPHMARARQCVRELGGLERTNSFTRFYLALAGAVGWEMVPAIPPELMLLPTWFYLNIYEMSSWSRAIVVPLMILYARRPEWRLPEEARVDELFRDPEQKLAAFVRDPDLLTWRNVFLALDRALKLYERLPWKPLRQRALDRARHWLLEHLERSEGLGAIYPAVMNAIFALIAMGHSPDDPITRREIGQLARFEIEEDEAIRLQPCVSPVWDTAIAMVALQEAGLPPDHPALVRAADWLIENQILGPGDWQVKNRDVEPGGWAFEFRNDFFPDVDDTAFVLMALQRVAHPDRARLEKSIRLGLAWMLSMQNRDGGWGAFDRDNDCWIFTQVPFADHNAMIDPSTADVTARVIECLARFGWPASHPVIRRAMAFLLRDQTSEGAWFGRWGVNYVYGTAGVLRALEPLGLAAQDYARRAVDWLRSVQHPDGSFGESIASYYDSNLKGKGDSTASQTAWGLIGYLAAGLPGSRQAGELERPEVENAVRWLLAKQNANGSWDEESFTGTGFPCVFYLKYHLYRHYFPLYALARFRNKLEGVAEFRAVAISPAEFNGRNGSVPFSRNGRRGLHSLEKNVER